MDDGPTELMAQRIGVGRTPVRSGGSTAQVVLAVTVNAFCILPSFLLSVMSVEVGADLHLDEVVVGLAFSVYWLVASLSAFPLAAVANRWGATRSLRGSGLAACLLCAVMTLSAHSAVTLIATLAIIGFTPALAAPAVNIVIMSGVRSRRRALAFAVASASPVVALMVAGLAGSLLEPLLGWRWVFVAGGLAAAALVPFVRTPAVQPAAFAAPGAQPVTVRPLAAMMSGILAGNLALGAATAFLVVAAPSEEVSTVAASLAVAVASGSSILLRVLLALVVDRRRMDPFPLCGFLLLSGCVGYALLALGGPVAFLVGVAMVLVPGWSWISLLVHGVMCRYRSAVATASGVVQIAYFIGGVIGPAAIGGLIFATSYRTAWWVLMAANMIAIVALTVGSRRLPPFTAD